MAMIRRKMGHISPFCRCANLPVLRLRRRERGRDPGPSALHVMRQTGHRSTVMVRRYIREGALFRDNAAGRVGL